MGETNISDRSAAWSSYWAQGALHSCVGSYAANYAGAIGEFWRSTFEGVRQGDHVLDLATGNGPLPLLLWEQHGAGKQLVVDAVDQATIRPAWYSAARYPGIRFHPGVSIEQLPFADHDFDWVVSQFGMEYARRPDSLRECIRVVKPGGTLAFVIHHAGSVLVSVGRHELANLEFLLAPAGLIAAARQVIPWVARARASSGDAIASPAALQCRTQYNEAMAALAGQIETSAVPDALADCRQWIHGMLAGIRGGDGGDALQALERYRESMQDAALRTAEMIEHALDGAQVDALAGFFTAARPGSLATCEPIRQAEGILGWAVVISPPDR